MKKLVTTTPDPEFNIPDSKQKRKSGKPEDRPREVPPLIGSAMQEEPAPEELRPIAHTESQQDEPRSPDGDG